MRDTIQQAISEGLATECRQDVVQNHDAINWRTFARLEYFDATPVPVALIEMTTQDRSPATHECLQALSCAVATAPSSSEPESLLMGAEDIGQFRPMRFIP